MQNREAINLKVPVQIAKERVFTIKRLLVTPPRSSPPRLTAPFLVFRGSVRYSRAECSTLL
jgi:hypothetical protein